MDSSTPPWDNAGESGQSSWSKLQSVCCRENYPAVPLVAGSLIDATQKKAEAYCFNTSHNDVHAPIIVQELPEFCLFTPMSADCSRKGSQTQPKPDGDGSVNSCRLIAKLRRTSTPMQMMT